MEAGKVSLLTLYPEMNIISASAERIKGILEATAGISNYNPTSRFEMDTSGYPQTGLEHSKHGRQRKQVDSN
jgi:hypothetical protein